MSAQSLERLIFYLLILFLPTQLGKHFWPDFSIVSGIRVDYLSPTLYLTDILIVLLLVQFLISNFQFQFKFKIFNFKLIFLLVFLLIGIIFSKNPLAGAFGILKFLELLFLGFYVAINFKKFGLKNILLLFSAGIIFESLLAIAQYFQQASLGNIFYWFGERTFNLLTPGIANASLNGSLILRPYGTFSHPNVLAGYLVIGMTLVLGGIKNYELRIKKVGFILTLTIGTIALFLTLSRIAILLWLIVFGSWFAAKIYTKLKTKFSIFHILSSIFALAIVILIFLNSNLHTRFTGIRLYDESIVQRENLIRSSLSMIKDHPIFGVGLNNFLVNLPSYQISHPSLFYLQPVHNLFLLIASETGIIGLIFSLWFIFVTYKKIINKSLIHNSLFPSASLRAGIILSSILILGLFDHYFLTLQQGQLLLALAFGLCWSKEYET